MALFTLTWQSAVYQALAIAAIALQFGIINHIDEMTDDAWNASIDALDDCVPDWRGYPNPAKLFDPKLVAA